MENNNHIPRRGSVPVAFLIGAVVGGVTALLLAPESGAQMRRRLKRGAHDLQEKGSTLAHDMSDRVETATGAMKGAVSEARITYREELEKRRGAAATTEPKRFTEPEPAGPKPRTQT